MILLIITLGMGFFFCAVFGYGCMRLSIQEDSIGSST